MDTNNNSFDPTPRLKSSSVSDLFIPFNNDENKCEYCEHEYSRTLKFEQRYCKNCLTWYIQHTTAGNNACLDTYIITNNVQCIEHGVTRNGFYTTNIQEWCKHCSEVSYFKQIIPNTSSFNNYYLSRKCPHDNYSKTNCQLCEIMLQSFGYSPDYYQISSGWVESTLTKKSVPILYLPWWDIYDKCVVCSQELELTIQLCCQRWCSHCFTIYTGCRYCLTTNIIFGITGQSQCVKCKRISSINIDIQNIISGNWIIDEFIVSKRINYNNFQPITNYLSNNTNLNPLNVYGFIRNMLYLSKLEEREIKLIPYHQIKNSKKIAEGGFSIIYKATYRVGIKDTDVAIKRLRDSQNISRYFLNELKSLYKLNNWYSVINCYGITQDPMTKEYMLIMEYANGGNLHEYLQNNFIDVSWTVKLNILRYISLGLKQIHKIDLIHRDLHSGNILLSDDEMIQGDRWKIADLGLSQPANHSLFNNEIYGVIPYIAPEIFKFKGIRFSKASDIYSLGMIVWELTTGCKPFANVENDVTLICKIIDGERPEITNDTPECYANIMKKCWDPDPSKRPTIDEFWSCIIKWFDETSYTIYDGFDISSEFEETFKQAEEKRMKLIQSKKLGPKFSEKSHSKAFYSSRALSSLISNALTRNSFSTITSNINKEYITRELVFDIDFNSSIQSINSDAQSSIIPLNSSRKRNIKELKIDTQSNRKHTKVGQNDAI